MLKVAPKSAQNPLRKTGAQAHAVQRGQRAGSITLSGIRPRDILSFHFLALAIVVFFLLKVVLLSAYGTESYAGRVEMFMNGTSVEQFGGRLLDIDPITAALSNVLSLFL